MNLSPDVTIRTAELSDEAAIIDICYETRSLPELPEDEKYVFALRWALYYLRHQTDFCFVAEQNQTVIGYVLATPDTKSQESGFVSKVLPEIKQIVPPDHPSFHHYTKVGDIGEEVESLLPEFPAHLHINMTEACRGKGIGAKLIETVEEKLRSVDLPGLHLGVSKLNLDAVRFYQRCGFVLQPHDIHDKKTPFIMTKSL